MVRILIAIVAPFVLIWTAASVFWRGVKFAAIDAAAEVKIELAAIRQHWIENTLERNTDE